MSDERRKSCCDDIVQLKQIVLGNGTKGLADKVRSHEEWIQQVSGGWRAVKWIAGFVGLSNAAILVKMFLAK